MRTFTEEEVEEMMNSRVCQKPKTNADRIRSMSDEELEELINKVKMCGGLIRTEETSSACHGCKDGFCCNVKDWLQSEVEVSDER